MNGPTMVVRPMRMIICTHFGETTQASDDDGCMKERRGGGKLSIVSAR